MSLPYIVLSGMKQWYLVKVDVLISRFTIRNNVFVWHPLSPMKQWNLVKADALIISVITRNNAFSWHPCITDEAVESG